MITNTHKIQKAILLSKNGEKARAHKLLKEVEDSNVSGKSKTRTFIKAIRERYEIHEHTKKLPPDDLAQHNQGFLKGVTLVTCCMNRSENLLKALQTWLRCEEINEVIIVDWSSDYEVRKSLAEEGVQDERVRIIRSIDEPRWILSYAFNLGFRYARYNKTLKVDADIILKPDFFKKNKLKPGAFIAGSWELADKGQEYINGFFYTHTHSLLNIKGFNEYITTYGWDDDDIYARLSGHGLKRFHVDVNTIYHLPHDDAQRKNFNNDNAKNAEKELKDNLLFKIRANRYLAMVMPPWGVDREFAPFTILVDEDNYMEVRREKMEMPHYVSADMKENAEYHAAMELLSWRVGPQVYHLPRKNFYALINNKTLDEIDAQTIFDLIPKIQDEPATDDVGNNPNGEVFIHRTKPKLYIDAQHGLGNRMRAIASAAVIAQETERELVVVWQPDDHCDCRFQDIFDYEGEVIEKTFVTQAREDGLQVYNYMEIEENAEKDAELQLATAQDVYARSAYVLNSSSTSWDKENHFLRSLNPVSEVLDMVASVRAPNDLSAHIRMMAGAGLDHNSYDSSDNWTEEGHRLIHKWREKSHFSHFMKRIDVLIKEGRADRIFLATDMPETYEEFSNIYGDRVAYLPRDVYDRSARQMHYALADALLLGSALTLLGSTWSSFSELAMRMSPHKMKIEMSGKDF